MSGSTIVILGALALLIGLVFVAERGPVSAKDLALVATVAAAAAAGRVLFAAIPSVKPVTTICLVAGAALGARSGAVIGAGAALLSNAFLGQGPWTPPQMLLWAVVGASGALLVPAIRHPWALAAISAVWGFLFGWGMNLWQLAVYGPEVSPRAFWLASGRSIWFDTAGAVGNVVFSLAIGAALWRLLSRYSARIHAEIVWEEPARGAAGR
jgi:energy-coupling factor transport system substrate-specific component